MGVWEKAREELRGLFGGRALLARAEKEVYRYDAILVGPEPLAVVLPQSREEVQALVRLARRHGLPLVPGGQEAAFPAGRCRGKGRWWWPSPA